MSFQEFMHPRNPYIKPPDFKQLAEEFDDFKQYVECQKNGKYRIDFKNPSALRALTKVLLKKDFNLEVNIPENSIIPTVPQRLNYILWMEDLLAKLPNGSQTMKGIDIGTGATCIFPLLGFRKNGWRFVATEIDKESQICAEQNLVQNNLDDHIKIKKVSKGTILKEVFEDCNETFDFCLCNPPFFEDYNDQRKQKLPHFPKLPEVIVDGGEVSFVKKMIDDSLIFREKIKIYSSMLGKKKSVEAIVNVLKGIENVTHTMTNFCQGNTMRWGVAWTYLEVSDFNKSEIPKKRKRKKEKRPLSFMISSEDISFSDLLQKIKSTLNDFQIVHRDISVRDAKACLKIKSYQNTWTGQRRKRRELKRKIEACNMKSEKQESMSSNAEHHVREAASNFNQEVSEIDGEVFSKRRKLDCPPNNSTPSGEILSNQQKLDSPSESSTPSGEVLSKRQKLDCPSNSSTPSSSSACVTRNSTPDNMDKPILNCQIHLTKIENDFIFQLSCDLTSNPNVMHEIFQLFHNKLNPQPYI